MNVTGGYTFTLDAGSNNYNQASILGLYNGTYGWHQIIVQNNDTDTVTNVALLRTSDAYTRISSGTNNIVAFDGTTFTALDYLPKNTLYYLKGNCQIYAIPTLPAPTNISLASDILSFDSVNNAESYDIISDINESSQIILGTVPQ